MPQSTSEVDVEVAKIEQNAESIRGLKAKNDVPETFLTKDQMRINITKLFEEITAGRRPSTELPYYGSSAS